MSLQKSNFLPASWRRRVAAVALAALALFAPETARAERSANVEWNQDWARFRPAEIALTSGLALQVAAVTFVYPDPKANWHGGILFDDVFRDGLRLHTKSARARADEVSDAMYYGLLAYPLVDVGITAAVHSSDVAVQMLAMDLEAFAFTGAIALTAEKLGRVRPEERGCKTDPNYSDDCNKPAQLNASFMSGHTTMAFTGAGLICVHHQHLPLYGGGAPDTIACITALAAASTAGVMRVSADKHYSTDVLLGAAVGLFGGYGLPKLLHYGFGGGAGKKQASLLPTFQSAELGLTAVVAPAVSPESAGVMLVGTF